MDTNRVPHVLDAMAVADLEPRIVGLKMCRHRRTSCGVPQFHERVVPCPGLRAWHRLGLTIETRQVRPDIDRWTDYYGLGFMPRAARIEGIAEQELLLDQPVLLFFFFRGGPHAAVKANDLPAGPAGREAPHHEAH